MHLCYVDEAGCPGRLPSATSPVQPTLVMCGLVVPEAHLARLTNRFLTLKCRFDPALRDGCAHFLDSARRELKGSDLRSEVRRGGRNRRRFIFRFLDALLDLLEDVDARPIVRIYIKRPGAPFEGRAVYAASMQALCAAFQHFLEAHGTRGVIIADSRTPALNAFVAHSIFTQKFQVGGDPYRRLVEMPTFGHSENHVPIQITDLLCSAIITPIALSTYCSSHVASLHIHERDLLIRERYAQRIKALAYRHQLHGRWRGGVTVIDAIQQRPPGRMFAMGANAGAAVLVG